MDATQYRKDVMDILITAGCNPNMTGHNGETALHVASKTDSVHTAKMLIKAGINFNAQDKYGSTALHYATKKNHIETVRLLLAARVDLDIQNVDGRTALYYGEPEIIKLLLQANANRNLLDKTNKTAFHVALDNSRFDVVSVFNKDAEDRKPFTRSFIS